jgi:hypothetical protein
MKGNVAPENLMIYKRPSQIRRFQREASSMAETKELHAISFLPGRCEHHRSPVDLLLFISDGERAGGGARPTMPTRITRIWCHWFVSQLMEKFCDAAQGVLTVTWPLVATFETVRTIDPFLSSDPLLAGWMI